MTKININIEDNYDIYVNNFQVNITKFPIFNLWRALFCDYVHFMYKCQNKNIELHRVIYNTQKNKWIK